MTDLTTVSWRSVKVEKPEPKKNIIVKNINRFGWGSDFKVFTLDESARFTQDEWVNHLDSNGWAYFAYLGE